MFAWCGVIEWGGMLPPVNVTFECSIRYHQSGSLRDSRIPEDPPNSLECILEDLTPDPLQVGKRL